MDIQVETSRDPFCISFKRDDVLLLAVRPSSDHAIDLSVDSSSVRANFPRFSLHLNQLADEWTLTATGTDSPVELAVELPGHWYGHGELINQHWPLNEVMLQMAPLRTFDNGPSGLSGKLNPAWFSSRGTLIIAQSPVEVGINQPPSSYPHHKWSFTAEGRGPFGHRPFHDPGALGDGRLTFKGGTLHLKFFFSMNAVEAHERQIRYFGHPSEIPPDELFIKPTWTTWARYKTNIDQKVILQFAHEIIANDYPFHVMEIDDRWQVHYGDLDFDAGRFPDPRGMIDQLHAKGFKVTAWVIPFLSPESQAFAEGAKRGWLVKEKGGSPYLVQWWQGRGGLLDVTTPSALEWFFERLRSLQSRTGLDGFKFDAGEACFLPADSVTYRSIDPNEYTQIYVDAIAKQYALTEVRCGWRNQRAPIFFRQWDKTTSWGLDNGLHSVLTGILSMGMTGYPFILPDMVGGNEYEEKADAEMMIRWTQLNALLPAIQFSLAPWDYGELSASTCRQYARLHEQYSHRILELAHQATRTGLPIIRPIFWVDHGDERALTCNDEFLLGDELLVAPVISAGVRQRDIYLPRGTWQDHWTKQIFTGPQNLKEYPAPLGTLPFFDRIKP